MAIKTEDLKTRVIVPVLNLLELYSESAVNLLLGTAAQESHMGYWLKQNGGGPAIGIYQMEGATHNDIWTNYLEYRHELMEVVDSLRLNIYDSTSLTDIGEVQMAGNLYYATAMARVHYLRKPGALPAADDIEGLAHYWKDHYNTHQGKGTVEEFIHNYKKYVIGR